MRKLILAATVLLAACSHMTAPEGLTAADMKTVRDIEAKTTENWLAMPYLDSAKRSAGVNITLKADGSIENLTINQSSGNVNFDNGLLIAIRQSAPFKVPAGVQAPLNYNLVFTK